MIMAICSCDKCLSTPRVVDLTRYGVPRTPFHVVLGIVMLERLETHYRSKDRRLMNAWALQSLNPVKF